MARTDFSRFACSIARSLDVLGDTWSALVLRDVFMGITRFDDLQRDLGVARNVLTDRLDRLVDRGLLERRPYQERQVRYDYLLTGQGMDLVPTLLALVTWGDRWTAGEAGPPVRLTHRSCGQPTTATVCCSACGDPLHGDDIDVAAGPGGRRAPGTVVMAERLAPRPA